MSRIDLHVHSTASDGHYPPVEVVRRAAAAGLGTIALTDHDTLGGVSEAVEAGKAAGVRVIAGCEFSVKGPGGELHLLGYFLPVNDSAVEAFLADQREKRVSRTREMVRRLQHSGIAITEQRVGEVAGRGSWGRPHVARVLVELGAAPDIQAAFEKFIGKGKPGFVEKDLPTVESVTMLVRSVAGVTSAAHLKDRGVRPVLKQLRAASVDAVEVVHPSHEAGVSRRIDSLADELGLQKSGGTDWHGDFAVDRPLAALGSLPVPDSWLAGLEHLHLQRQETAK